MACCKCCCENLDPPGECCGTCCKQPSTCCGEGEGRSCCEQPRVCCVNVCCAEGECCSEGVCGPCADPTCADLYGDWEVTVNWCGRTLVVNSQGTLPNLISWENTPEEINACASKVNDFPAGAEFGFLYIGRVDNLCFPGAGAPITHGLQGPCECNGRIRVILNAASNCPGEANPGGQLTNWGYVCIRDWLADICDGQIVNVRPPEGNPAECYGGFNDCLNCEDVPESVTLAFGGAP